MKANLTTDAAFLALIVVLAVLAYAKPDWNAVGQALGKAGVELLGRVYRVALPRSDLKVTLDQPRLFFMHFWANNDAAKGLRAALDRINLAKS